jgi:hypothetical protein
MENLEQPQAEAKQFLKKKKKAVKAKPFKLTRFDRDLAGLVRSGVSNVEEILRKMAIDSNDFQKRVKTLVVKGYFVFDFPETKELRLGWKGYNLFAPKVKREKKSPLPKPLAEGKTEEAKPEQNPVASKPPGVPPIVQEKPFLNEKDVVVEVHSTADLADLLEKGSPTGRQARSPNSSLFIERQKQRETQAPSKPVRSDTGEALILAGKEACELCKAKFKLNVKNTEQAKYGHCFCGAAFHKDCYESLLDNGGNCVRCGRRLKLMFDRKTEDAVRGIKDAFE